MGPRLIKYKFIRPTFQAFKLLDARVTDGAPTRLGETREPWTTLPLRSIRSACSRRSAAQLRACPPATPAPQPLRATACKLSSQVAKRYVQYAHVSKVLGLLMSSEPSMTPRGLLRNLTARHASTAPSLRSRNRSNPFPNREDNSSKSSACH
jgi:hypothetical protein